MRAATIVVILAAVTGPAAAETAVAPETSSSELQLDLGLSVIGVAFEKPIGSHFAVQVEADITSTYFAPWFDAGQRVDGYALGLRGSWFAAVGSRGLYIAPYVRGARVTADGVAGSGLGASAGAFVGWAWRVTPHIDIRLGVGAQYYDYKVHDVGISSPFFGLDGVVGFRL